MNKIMNRISRWFRAVRLRVLSSRTHGLGSDMNLKLDNAAREKIQELMDRSEQRSPTQLFQKALVTYDILTDHMSNGGTVILRYLDGTERTFDPISFNTDDQDTY